MKKSLKNLRSKDQIKNPKKITITSALCGTLWMSQKFLKNQCLWDSKDISEIPRLYASKVV